MYFNCVAAPNTVGSPNIKPKLNPYETFDENQLLIRPHLLFKKESKLHLIFM